jgi:DnaJ homolog subfamily C member 25
MTWKCSGTNNTYLLLFVCALSLLTVLSSLTFASAQRPPHLPSLEDMYCGAQSCYEVLGIKRDASTSQLRRAYRKLTLKYHPDKNPEESAKEEFRKVVNAYEVLKDEESRKDYDYVLDHPEEYYRNLYRYYSYRYPKQANVYVVVGGFFLAISLFHWYYWQWYHNLMMSRLLETPEVQRRIHQLSIERGLVEKESSGSGPSGTTSTTAAARNRKKGRGKKPQVRIIEDEGVKQEVLTSQVKLNGWAGRLPVFPWDILPIIMVYVVFRFIKNMLWFSRYYLWCGMLGGTLNNEELQYKTAKTLRLSWERWLRFDEDKRNDWTARELWIPKNMKFFRQDMNREYNRKR